MYLIPHHKILICPLWAPTRKRFERQNILNPNAQNFHLEICPQSSPLSHDVLGSAHCQSEPIPFDPEISTVFGTPSPNSLQNPILQGETSSHINPQRVFLSPQVNLSSLLRINKFFQVLFLIQLLLLLLNKIHNSLTLKPLVRLLPH